ncbi:MAG: geopeptide radical SAM maturase [Deltaproteobacteria bacterium]|nr:geopeptide radical SAM maturase [Deltaproteobacteria bacterium]
MQLSHYLKIYQLEERPGQRLLFSTKRASMVLLDDEKYDSIGNGSLSPSDEAALLSIGMLTPDREEEKREVSSMLDRLNANNTGLNLAVFINLDCNFACPYCYEGGLKGKIVMSDETADLLIAFIKEKFGISGPGGAGKTALNLDFYGGEPLLSLGLIKRICSELKAFTEARGAEFTFSLVTNGSLFRRRVAEELYPLGLRRAKITLDGPAETHNISRPFKSGAASFDIIINNIKETCDIVKIGIGGNFTRDNHEKFLDLISYLKAGGLTPDKLPQIKFDPVLGRPPGDTGSVEYVDACMSVNEPWVTKAGDLLREAILQAGYATPRITPMPCQVELRNAYVVNHDGVVYKCPALIGRKGFEIGDVKSGITDYTVSHRVGIWKNEECLACEYLPLCFGGCRYMAYVRDGNIDNPDCKRPYLDASLEGLVKQDIKYSGKANSKF